MEHLILVNFEKDPDEFYNTFELQQARDKNNRKRFLVIAYRIDGGSDVYHQPDYPFASQSGILNNAEFIESPLDGAKFEINDDSLDVFFSFTDKSGRKITVKVNEDKTKMKKPALFVLVSVLFLLQISPILPFADYGIRPDFVLVLTVFFGIQFPLCGGAFLVFGLGCLVEVFSGVNNGLYPIIYLTVFIGIRSLERFFDFSQSVNLFLLTASALIVRFMSLFASFCKITVTSSG